MGKSARQMAREFEKAQKGLRNKARTYNTISSKTTNQALKDAARMGRAAADFHTIADSLGEPH